MGEPDDYRCQLIPWPEEQTTYVTALRVIPDQRPIVHHTIAFLIGPEQVADFRAYEAAEEAPATRASAARRLPGPPGASVVGCQVLALSATTDRTAPGTNERPSIPPATPPRSTL